jgi:hypothetical protein
VTIGVIIFYPAINVSLGLQKHLSDFNVRVGGLKLHQLIPQVLSIFMYGCFSYAFCLCRKNLT